MLKKSTFWLGYKLKYTTRDGKMSDLIKHSGREDFIVANRIWEYKKYRQQINVRNSTQMDMS